jgi:3-phosphoshikimate 1-carboxyvinyltransferase
MQRTIELVSKSSSVKGIIDLPASKSISNRLLIIEAITNGRIRGIGYSDAYDTQKYQQKEGFAPLIIRGKQLKGGKIPIDASTSSQFLSALLLVAPSMEKDLVLEPQGQIISQPYLQMTINLMLQCGFQIEQLETTIRVHPFIPSKQMEIAIEKDWSAASYWYSMVALSYDADITLSGLHLNSIQGDMQCAEIFRALGVETVETDSGIRLEKTQMKQTDMFIDCIKTPDLFQTYAVTASALKLNVHFWGLQSLRLKETDRIWAVCNELSKMGVKFSYTAHHEVSIDSQNFRFDQSYSIETYEDHRMAMAFAPLVLKLPSLMIQHPNVVEKSYPSFWLDIHKVL